MQVELCERIREEEAMNLQIQQLSSYVDDANSDCRKLSADLKSLQQSKDSVSSQVSLAFLPWCEYHPLKFRNLKSDNDELLELSITLFNIPRVDSAGVQSHTS